jgi:3-keto-5-aminohexanoate cleavage enzyme
MSNRGDEVAPTASPAMSRGLLSEKSEEGARREGVRMFEPPTHPVVISCAITGNKTTREMNPHLPLTPKEQGVAAAEAVDAGASVIHLHVREDDGAESHSLERFAEAVAEIQAKAPSAIIEVSTRAAVGEDIEYRGNCLELRTEMCSLNVGSINIDDEVFLNAPKDVRRLAERIYQCGVEPELDCFDVGHMESIFVLKRAGVLRDPLRFLLVLGIRGGVTADPRNLVHMVSLLPPDAHWCALGIGRFQLTIAMQALAMGGNVRVGLEDTAYYARGELATSNAQLVDRVARLARELGREVASPDVARSLLQIPPRRSPGALESSSTLRSPATGALSC